MGMYPYSNFLNHYNLVACRQQPFIKLRLTKKHLLLTQLFYKLGAIQNYLILTQRTGESDVRYIMFTGVRYKGLPYYSSVRLITRPSKHYTITYKTLLLVSRLIKGGTMLLSTGSGIMTHRDALKRRMGGVILFVLL